MEGLARRGIQKGDTFVENNPTTYWKETFANGAISPTRDPTWRYLYRACLCM